MHIPQNQQVIRDILSSYTSDYVRYMRMMKSMLRSVRLLGGVVPGLEGACCLGGAVSVQVQVVCIHGVQMRPRREYLGQMKGHSNGVSDRGV